MSASYRLNDLKLYFDIGAAHPCLSACRRRHEHEKPPFYPGYTIQVTVTSHNLPLLSALSIHFHEFSEMGLWTAPSQFGSQRPLSDGKDHLATPKLDLMTQGFVRRCDKILLHIAPAKRLQDRRSKKRSYGVYAGESFSLKALNRMNGDYLVGAAFRNDDVKPCCSNAPRKERFCCTTSQLSKLPTILAAEQPLAVSNIQIPALLQFFSYLSTCPLLSFLLRLVRRPPCLAILLAIFSLSITDSTSRALSSCSSAPYFLRSSIISSSTLRFTYDTRDIEIDTGRLIQQLFFTSKNTPRFPQYP
ncbi:hypothetical protein BDZ45DRAFT_734900 [Acephala macrosclerotiorum]|nr:hypothetical protein BDZ45DRAFT_734900 [Acephala macrosclerotiorum]